MIGAVALSMVLMVAPDTLASGHIESSALFELINDYRASKGLRKLQYNPDTQKDVDRWALKVTEDFRHDSNTKYAVENVSHNGSPTGALDAWIKSPGHNRNMLDPSIDRGTVSVYVIRYSILPDEYYAVFRGYRSNEKATR